MEREPILFYPGNFDYINGPIKCVVCGKVTDDTFEADLQTKVSGVPKGRLISVGDELVGYPDPRGLGLFNFSGIYDPKEFSFIEPWDCKTCDDVRWVYCKVKDGKLASVEAISLSADLLSATDLVSDQIQDLVPAEVLKENNIQTWRITKSDPAKFINLVAKYAKNGSAKS